MTIAFLSHSDKVTITIKSSDKIFFMCLFVFTHCFVVIITEDGVKTFVLEMHVHAVLPIKLKNSFDYVSFLVLLCKAGWNFIHCKNGLHFANFVSRRFQTDQERHVFLVTITSAQL